MQPNIQASAGQVGGGQQSHPNLFQEAVLQHAASVTATQNPQGPGSDQQSRFAALHTLNSSDSSTTSGNSGSSSGSGSSVMANIPARPTYQSIGPHANIPFDL